MVKTPITGRNGIALSIHLVGANEAIIFHGQGTACRKFPRIHRRPGATGAGVGAPDVRTHFRKRVRHRDPVVSTLPTPDRRQVLDKGESQPHVVNNQSPNGPRQIPMNDTDVVGHFEPSVVHCDQRHHAVFNVRISARIGGVGMQDA